MNAWPVLIAGGLLTYLIRLSFIVLLGRVETPLMVQRALRFVPPAVLSAIIFQQILLNDGEVFLSPLNPRLLAGIVAVVVAWRTRNALLTIAVGMAALILIGRFL